MTATPAAAANAIEDFALRLWPVVLEYEHVYSRHEAEAGGRALKWMCHALPIEEGEMRNLLRRQREMDYDTRSGL